MAGGGEKPSEKQNGSTTFSDARTADREADLRNNDVGYELGKTLPAGTNARGVANAALNLFENKGLSVVKKNDDGTFSVVTTTVGKKEADKTREDWNKRENDTGFTAEGRKAYDDMVKTREWLNQNRKYEE